MEEGVQLDLAVKLSRSLVSSAYALARGVKLAEITKLNDTVSLIKAFVRDAEEQQRNNNDEVKVWLQQLKDVLYDVDNLLDDFCTEAQRYSLKIGHRVKAIIERLDKIAAGRVKFHLSDHPVEPVLEHRKRDQTHYSFVRQERIIGRDYDKRNIVELLVDSDPDENLSIIPIIGIGGIGKTTLAQMVFNDEKVEKHFELKMWVCVTEMFELKVIAEKIIEAATGGSKPGRGLIAEKIIEAATGRSKPGRGLRMETPENRLEDMISGKKYLLVLDDVWNEDYAKWLKLRFLLLRGAKGSWIVITTRSERVANTTGAVWSCKLEGLSAHQSWLLLKQIAFKEESQESNNSRLEAIGMEIAEQCKGVPLALTAIGSLLVKRTKAEWLEVKNNVLKYTTRQDSVIFPILKLSYDHLPPHLRQCFAYCSVLPKDTRFEVKEIIILWMAQGFIQSGSGDEDLEYVGHEYFMNLLQRSFFQVVNEDDSGNVVSFTMHDLMHDLACSVAGIECCIASVEAENVREDTRHVLFEDKVYFSWKIPSSLLKANTLRTLILGGTLNQSTCNALVSKFVYLRTLRLSYVGIETLPHSIGKLKHLRILNLSGNVGIKKLPSSLCRLQNLQRLVLSYCSKLEKLPRKTRRLVSLRYLDIDSCYRLAYMPRGLGQLTCLRMLNKFVVGRRGREVGQLRELKGLNNIQGEIVISSLQNAVAESGSASLRQKLNLKSLLLRWDEVNNEEDDVKNVTYEMVFEGLQPHPNLEKLEVHGYPGSKISSWLSSVTNLTELTIRDCVKCKYLPPLHQLSSLKFLQLSGLEALENVSEIEMQRELSSSSESTTILPSLERLEISDCPNLKGWWRGDVDEASNAQLPCFPCLSDLRIIHCPSLTSMPLFPSFGELYLDKTRWKPVLQTDRNATD